MKKLLCGAFLSVVALSLGCAITDYPVIFDSRGPYDNNVMTGQYDHAYIIPSSSVATIWSDGSDELNTYVAQDWKGDQWLKTYNNFDASGALNFLDQTYCDPVRQGACAVVTAWNPDVAGDDPFDYTFDTSCSGARSLSLLLGVSSRIGECGSGVMADKQGAAYEFSNLETVSFRGKSVYHLPIDNSIASFTLTGADGAVAGMPIYGRFNAYIDQRLRTMLMASPNARYNMRWMSNFATSHGSAMNVALTYGSLNADYSINVRLSGLAGAANRL